MSSRLRARLIVGGLLVLLTVSLAGNACLYRSATRPLYWAEDQPLIERTIARAAIVQHTDMGSIRSHNFPIAFHLPGRSCVEMRDNDGGGFYVACYDRNGRVIEEIAGVDF